MARNIYYVQENEEKDSDKSNFLIKMNLAGYKSIGSKGLLEKNNLIQYDINDVGVFFTHGYEDFLAYQIGNIEMFGRLEDIIQTQKEIEERTGLKLNQIGKTMIGNKNG